MIAKNINDHKYIKTKARNLPIHACWIHRNWEETKMTNVFVVRKHTNGNFSIGFYLVDLLCLGVKDSFFMFNVDEGFYLQTIEDNNKDLGEDEKLIETEYAMAHNIIFAGYEFATEIGIPQNKEFEQSLIYFLEEDDENVPLMEIECGEDGIPAYWQSPLESSAFAKKIIRILEKNVGKDNFKYYLLEDFEKQGDEMQLFDNEENLSFDKINIDNVKENFTLILQNNFPEISDQEREKLTILSYTLSEYYLNHEVYDYLMKLWNKDYDIYPHFIFDEMMNEDGDERLLTIFDKDDYDFNDVYFIQKSISNESLADYMIMNLKIQREEVNNNVEKYEFEDEIIEEVLQKNFEVITENIDSFCENHPNYLLGKMRLIGAEFSYEELTVKNIFKNQKNVSEYEFREFINSRQSYFFRNKDLTGLIASIAVDNLDFDLTDEEMRQNIYLNPLVILHIMDEISECN